MTLGLLGLPTLGLLLVGALAGIVLGTVALVMANRRPEEYGGQGLAIAGIATSVLSIAIMPVVLGIVAAIAIPSFLRARVSANESAAISDVRTVVSAEEAYRAINGGYYDALECLSGPSNCLRGYKGPAFLDASLASARRRSGYVRHFHPGPPPDATDLERADAASVSRSSLTTYAYVAVPERRGQTGVRSFCGDASGRICYLVDGSEPSVDDGACPEACQDLR